MTIADGARFATVRDTAGLLGVSPRTVWVMLENGELRSVKLRGRRLIPVAAIEELIAALEDDAS